jgi:hypothetical protein
VFLKALANEPCCGKISKIPLVFGHFDFHDLMLDTLGVTGSSPVAPNHNSIADRNLRESTDGRERRLNL